MKKPRFATLRAALQALRHGLRTFPYTILGWFVVPFLYRYRDVPLDVMQKEHPRLMFAVNPEDWTGGWRGHEAGDNCVPDDLREEFSGAFGFWRYHALRNSASGLRLRDWHNLPLEAGAIEYWANEEADSYEDWWLWKYRNVEAGDSWSYVARQGPYIGTRYIKYFKVFGTLYFYENKFGWRITPGDAAGPIKGSLRWQHGTTPTFQPIHIGKAGRDYE